MAIFNLFKTFPGLDIEAVQNLPGLMLDLKKKFFMGISLIHLVSQDHITDSS